MPFIDEIINSSNDDYVLWIIFNIEIDEYTISKKNMKDFDKSILMLKEVI